MAEAAGGLGPGLRRRAVGGLEGVHAAADHEAGLLLQHVADRPHLAGVVEALAQQAGRGVGAAVAVFREGHRHHRQARQVIGQGLDLLVGLDAHADPAAVGRQQRVALGLEAGQRQDHVAGFGDRVLVGDMDEAVVGESGDAILQLNQLGHRPPP
jgi:hypothetical protein